ncbi:hypothetical protein [Microbacterium sp. TNHR37B]|uniref:hypothetical protein n=1 Tax=Microbacterium sp. TNHR37B TaxID=1775956 RepID=UPI0007B27342|nr:hypothetical protein [Microbacterium sp. TNHR37B]KZE91146.1 hypothetical protein AVP41_00681 [Microbacterium sp. TNHR37B]
MTDPRDDDGSADAFSWDGDDDPTLVHGGRSAPASPDLPAGFTAVGKGSERVRRSTGERRSTEGPNSTGEGSAPVDATSQVVSESEGARRGADVALVALGVLAGVYALYTVGWIVGGMRLQNVAVVLSPPLGALPALWLAVLAPTLWFAGSVWFTRGRSLWQRFVWLIAGAAVLIPWPFVLVGTVGT